MWNNPHKNQKQQKSCFSVRRTYKPIIILNKISKKWTNIQEASG